MNATTRHIGSARKRVEDPRLIQGLATYVDDIQLPGLLHALILRSPYAHAKINGIKTEAAKAVPGVCAVFIGSDVNAACGLVKERFRDGIATRKRALRSAQRA